MRNEKKNKKDSRTQPQNADNNNMRQREKKQLDPPFEEVKKVLDPLQVTEKNV